MSKISKIICCNRDTSSSFSYCSEIFKLCSRYDCLNVWLGISIIKANKINPLNEIRRILEASSFKKDLKKALESQCLYTTLFIMPYISNYKGYKIESFLKQIGTFSNAEGRKLFLYALLDTCKYELHCPRCNSPHKDIISHVLSDCTESSLLRLQFRAKLVFYGVSSTFNFKNKQLFFLSSLEGKRSI